MGQQENFSKRFLGQACKYYSKLLLPRKSHLHRIYPRGWFYIQISCFCISFTFFSFSLYDLLNCIVFPRFPLPYFHSKNVFIIYSKDMLGYVVRLIQEQYSFVNYIYSKYEINLVISRRISQRLKTLDFKNIHVFSGKLKFKCKISVFTKICL